MAPNPSPDSPGHAQFLAGFTHRRATRTAHISTGFCHFCTRPALGENGRAVLRAGLVQKRSNPVSRSKKRLPTRRPFSFPPHLRGCPPHFPPQGPREASSPGSWVLWGTPTSAAHPAALADARRLPPVAPAVRSLETRRRSQGLELSGLAAPPGQIADRDGRTLSSSQGVLLCLCPALGPRRDRCVRPYNAATRPPSE